MEPLIGLMGYAQAGKDTFAAATGYRRLAFADVLKAVAYDSSPLVWSGSGMYDPFEAPDTYLNTIVDEYGWDRAKIEISGVREFLQRLGAAVRDHLDPDAWVRAAFNNYDPSVPTVFTDVRYENEFNAIRQRGGYIVKIVRTGHAPANSHKSETFCDLVQPNFTVVAEDGDVEGLRRKAGLFAASFQLNEVWS